jgi:type IV pilus assembly protein PilQ
MRALLLVVALVSSPAFAAAKRVSLEFVNADVTSVLRMFADLGRFNLVAADSVSGKVTLSLRNVPWDQAFEAVLASKGLGMERSDSIIRVAPLKELADEAAQRAQLEDARLDAAPVRTTLLRVNYANAADLANQVKASLSRRGSVSVDPRTNTLIIRDVE